MSEKKPKSRRSIKISHSLTRAAQRLTLPEKRLIMFAISRMNQAEGNPPIEIRAKEYGNQYGLAPTNAYRELKTVCKSIMRKPPVTLITEQFDREINWAEYCDYFTNEGRIILQFTNKMSTHISGLESFFTSYKLLDNKTFRSLYAWRLYELIRQFPKSCLLKRKVSEFIEQMEIPESYAKDFGAIRRRIIKPALSEIKEKTGLVVKFKAEKKGRTVDMLYFDYSAEHQTELYLPDNVPKKEATPPPKREKTKGTAMPANLLDLAAATSVEEANNLLRRA